MNWTRTQYFVYCTKIRNEIFNLPLWSAILFIAGIREEEMSFWKLISFSGINCSKVDNLWIAGSDKNSVTRSGIGVAPPNTSKSIKLFIQIHYYLKHWHYLSFFIETKKLYVDLPLSLPLVVLITLRLSPLQASLINGCFS